ncbi:MAG: hypothetical protein E7540_06160 [Ruminococcaceae bacterium]|nr:hypothetical protein [Oscillospiraceae bacterium]
MSNLKLDIIYYNTSSDFEMEFNLSGCYRMRIFKDKIESKKQLVSALARDVSRSKVILVVTDLFGEDSAIPTLSRAIGIPLISPNKEEFGITTTEEIVIPNSAVPLVTKTGIYGGFIIEKGQQSIIIVSNVRSLRHEIMKTYVHNYIFDVGQLLAYQERIGQNGQSVQFVPVSNVSQPSEDEETISEQPQPSEEKTDEDENSSENLDSQAVTEEAEQSVESDAEVLEDNSKEETNTAEKVTKNLIEPGINHTADLEELALEEPEEPKKKNTGKTRKATNIILLIIVILLLIAFGVLAYFFVYLPAIGLENPILNEQNGFFYELINSFR